MRNIELYSEYSTKIIDLWIIDKLFYLQGSKMPQESLHTIQFANFYYFKSNFLFKADPKTFNLENALFSTFEFYTMELVSRKFKTLGLDRYVFNNEKLIKNNSVL